MKATTYDPKVAALYLRRARDAAELAEAKQSDALKYCGWTQKCDNPGSFWLWETTIAGKPYTLPTHLAVRVQEAAIDLGLDQ